MNREVRKIMDTSPALAFENEVANVVADRMTDLGLQQSYTIQRCFRCIGYQTLTSFSSCIPYLATTACSISLATDSS